LSSCFAAVPLSFCRRLFYDEVNMDGQGYGGNVRKHHHGGVTWVDVYDPGPAVLERLEKDYKLHPMHLHESLQKVQHSQVEREDHYLFLVMHFPVSERHGDKVGVGQLGMFLGRDFVITVHAEHAPFIDDLYVHCVRAVEKDIMRSSAYLAYIVIARLLGSIAEMIEAVDVELDETESVVFENSSSDAQRIGRLREKIIRLRRLIGPKRILLEDLVDQVGAFSGKDLAHYYANNVKTANRLWESVEEAKETVEIYKDADFITSTEKTNEILAVLTLVFTFTIPVTVVAGLYGMNVPLPGGVTSHVWTFFGRYTTFGLALLVSIFAALAMYAYFHKKRWF
jgi:magnesium transporter